MAVAEKKVATIERALVAISQAQGAYWYRCLATMREEWLTPLLTAYEDILAQHEFLAQILLFRSVSEPEK